MRKIKWKLIMFKKKRNENYSNEKNIHRDILIFNKIDKKWFIKKFNRVKFISTLKQWGKYFGKKAKKDAYKNNTNFRL